MLSHFSVLAFFALRFVQGLSRERESDFEAVNFAKEIKGMELVENVIKVASWNG